MLDIADTPLDFDIMLPNCEFKGLVGIGHHRYMAHIRFINNCFIISPMDKTHYKQELVLPFSMFSGIAIKSEAIWANGEEDVSLYLICENEDLSIPVFHGAHTQSILPKWYLWQDAHDLIPMVSDERKGLYIINDRSAHIQINAPCERRQNSLRGSRRTNMSYRDHFRMKQDKHEILSTNNNRHENKTFGEIVPLFGNHAQQ